MRYASGVGAVEYVSPRSRKLTAQEVEVRRIAYALRDADPRAVDEAAEVMAPFVTAGSTLVPVPSSQGLVTANLALAEAIATRVRAKVVVAVGRRRKVASSRLRRLAGGRSLRPDEHGFEKLRGVSGRVLFIDNVMTTGSTFEAMREALGRGSGLAYAVVAHGSREPG